MRLFVAVWPPADVLDAVAALPRPDVAGLRWTTRDQWHVTLRFLGSVDDPEAASAALAAVRAPTTAATVGPLTGRFGRRILHVPVGGLEQIAADVIGATAAVGEPPEDRPFHGHLTLARARDRRGVDLRSHCGRPVEGSFPVEEVTLVQSELGRGEGHGARYTVIARQPLSRG